MLPFTRQELSDAAERVGLCALPLDGPVSFLPTYINAAIVHGFASGSLKDGTADTEMLRSAVASLRNPPHLLEFKK